MESLLEVIVKVITMSGYELYRHPIEDDTLALVRYCHHKGFRMMPSVTYERNTHLSDENLPAIHVSDTWYYGISGVLDYFSRCTGLHRGDLLERALAFHKRHPDYHIHDS